MKIRPFLPASSAPTVFGFLLSGLMSLIVSFLSTIRTLGLDQDTWSTWMGAWSVSWLVAFPVVLLVAPFVHSLVAWITFAGLEND